MECVKVKEEPLDIPEIDHESELHEPQVQNGLLLGNIKKEIDMPDVSTTAEPSNEPPVEDSNKSWEVPITHTQIVSPHDFLEVSIKIEPANSYPDLDQHSSSPPSPDQTPTSSNNEESSGKSSLVCKICNKGFASASNVQRHVILHSKQKYHCTECPKEFISRKLFDKHRRSHMDATQKALAIAKNELTYHPGKSRKRTKDPIICHICNKVFKFAFLLKGHLRSHDSARPYACDHCTITFKYKSTLGRHMKTHNEVKGYFCPVCNRSFTHSGLIKPHMKVHTGEKPFPCPLCDKRFSHKQNMQRHLVRHNKVKQLDCNVCHRSFPKESRLIYHMQTHTNEKYFSCHICPKRFSHKQNAVRHYKRKHPNSTFECTETDASVAVKVWETIKNKNSEEPEEILG